LMRENGIVAIRTRKYKVTTDSNHTLAVAPNLLDRDFSATARYADWLSTQTSAQFEISKGVNALRMRIILALSSAPSKVPASNS